VDATTPDHQRDDVISRRAVLVGGLLIGATVLTGAGFVATQPGPVDAGSPHDAFIHLSTLVTGFSASELDERAATAIYDELAANPPAGAASLDELFARAGYRTSSPPRTLADLEHRGVFTDQGTAALTDHIIDVWYSGILPTAAGDVTVTWDGALGWQALAYTSAPGNCPGRAVWATNPALAA
jgi:hypothetical protein